MSRYLCRARRRVAFGARHLVILLAVSATTTASYARADATVPDAQRTQNGKPASGAPALATSAELDAVMAGDLDRLRAALADSNAVETGTNRSLLMYAAANGHFDIVRFLIERGARIDNIDNEGKTALMWASDTRLVNSASGKASNPAFRKIVEFLLSRGASATRAANNGLTPLLYAAARGHVDIMQPLLDKGAALNGASNNGWTALMQASNNGQLRAVRFLLGKHADIDVRDRDGLTALMLATLEQHAAVAKLLLAAGADVNAASKDGVTPLIAAAILDYGDVARILLDHKADHSLRTTTDLTALMIAQRDGRRQIATLLSKAGATE